MTNNVLIAVICKMVDEKLAKLPGPVHGLRGFRGAPGQDGKDFVFADHEETIKSWVKEFALKLEDLSAEQIEMLRGPRGRDGTDGKDFSFEEHVDWISATILEHVQGMSDGLKLQFSDLTAEEIGKLRGPRGQRGREGRDGKDFNFQEHDVEIAGMIRDQVANISDQLKFKFSDFTAEEISQLRGPRGVDGRDGKDFVFEDNRADIQSLIKTEVQNSSEDLKLKFADLSADDISQLRGPRGRDGRDFILADHSEWIKSTVSDLVNGMSDSFKMKFSDLTEEEINKLRGPRGRDGRDGKSFVFEEHEEFFKSLKLKFSDLTAEERESLVLKFSGLTDEEKNSLKLKFSDLTDEDRIQIKGPRGQRGRPGRDGEKGERGENGQTIRGLPGPRGISGLPGPRGKDGQEGRDGRDAPYITSISVNKKGKDFTLVFHFSDGSEIESDEIEVPKVISETWVVGGGVGRRSSGGSGLEDEETFDLVNNQAVAADIDGMIVGDEKSYHVHYYIERVTTGAGATELYQTGFGMMTKIGSDYRWTQIADDADAGIIITASALGQFQYVSTDITGTPSVSKINWRFSRLTG